MFRRKQSMRVLLGLVLPVTLVSQVVSASPVQSRTVQSNVQVVDLRVDGRDDQPVGIDDPNPLLAWRMVATPRAALHRCYRSDISVACPTDRQTAYQIQAASDESNLRKGRVIWDSGRVESAVQSGVPYAGTGPGLARAGRLAGAGVGRGQPAVGVERPVLLGDGSAGAESTGGRPAGSSIPDASRPSPCRYFARPFTVDPRKTSHRGPSLPGRCRTAPAHRERTDAHRRGPRPGQLQLPALHRVPDLRRHRRPPQGRQHPRRPARQRPGLRPTQRHQPGRRPDRALLVVAEPAQGQPARWSPTPPRTRPASKWTASPNYHVGGTINVDTGNGGDSLESRVITAIGTAGVDGTGITFTPGLTKPHATGASVTGSGNNIAATDPSAGAAVTPRLIARLEISYSNGDADVVVSDRTWRSRARSTRHRRLVLRRRLRRPPRAGRLGRTRARTCRRPRSAATGRTWAGSTPVSRRRRISPPSWSPGRRQPMKVVETFAPVSLTNPVPGTWVFDFGQNIVGWPRTAPAGLAAGRDHRPDVAGRVARRRRHRRPGLADGRRRQPWARPVQHLHHGGGARRGAVAPGLQLLRHAVGAGHRPARGIHTDHRRWSRACACRP